MDNNESLYLRHLFDKSIEFQKLSNNIDINFLNLLMRYDIKNCDLISYISYIRYITSGAYSNISEFCFKVDTREEECFPFILRVVRYLGKHNSQSPENVDWAIMELLFKLYEKGEFPFLIIPIISFVCESSRYPATDLLQLIDSKNNDLLPRDKKINIDLKNGYINKNNNQFYDFNSSLYRNNALYRFTILEKIETGTVYDYLETLRKPLTWDDHMYIIYNIVLILNSIYKYYPGFRHNDLHCGNVFYRKTDLKEIKIGSETLKIRNGFYLLINDFDFSFIDQDNLKLLNSKVDRTWVDYQPSQYYDYFKFINSYYDSYSHLFPGDELKKIISPTLPHPNFLGRKILNDYYDYYKDDPGDKYIVDFFGFNLSRDKVLKYFKKYPKFDESKYSSYILKHDSQFKKFSH